MYNKNQNINFFRSTQMTLDQTLNEEIQQYLRGHHDEEDAWGCEKAANKLKRGNPTEAIECLEAFMEAANEDMKTEEEIGSNYPNFDMRKMVYHQLDADRCKAWIAALKK